jgi:AraC-like DNA-binding protein
MGRIRLVTQETLGFKVWRGFPRAMIESHAHTELEWNFLLSGSMRYFIGGRFYEIQAGRLAVFWAGIPHVLREIGAGTECIWVTLPLAWFMQWRISGPVSRRLLSGEILFEPEGATGQTEWDRTLLSHWVENMRSASADWRRVVMLEAEARLRRLALALDRHTSPLAPGTPAGPALARVTAFIGCHYREDLSIAQIAGHAGLHPNYLMQLFKRSCGMGLWEYVLRLRISHAQRLLLMSNATILDVAYDSGFTSASRFYETFRRLTGQTPGHFRRWALTPR